MSSRQKSEEEKFIWLKEKILPNFQGSGVIYTGTRSDAEIYSKMVETLWYKISNSIMLVWMT